MQKGDNTVQVTIQFTAIFVRGLRAITNKLVVSFFSKIVVGIGLTELPVHAPPFHQPKAHSSAEEDYANYYQLRVKSDVWTVEETGG